MRARRGVVREAVLDEVRVSLTPMIDVTFLILIFFMCTLNFRMLNRKFVTWLPLDQGLRLVTATPRTVPAITLRVPASERARPPAERSVVFGLGTTRQVFGRARLISGAEAARHVAFDPPETPRRIVEFLLSCRRADPVLDEVKVDADPRVLHAFMGRTLDCCVAAGFERVTYTGIPPRLGDALVHGALR